MSARFVLYTPKTGNEKLDVPTEYLEVTFAPAAPGSTPDVMFREATDADRDRYRGAYREFKKGAPAAAAPAIPEAEVSETAADDTKPGFFARHKKGK